jgi:ATP-dependent exoDNAse (exonuclease V) alpha subunit
MSKFSPSQEYALDAFESKESFFLTGKAGTGKSFVVSEIIRRAQAYGLQTIICAPTGLAANNIGGTTIHSVFKAPVRPLSPTEKVTNKKARKLLEASDLIIIDEISMCRVDLFGYVARSIIEANNTSSKRKQVILVGDLYQLCPILDTNNVKNAVTFYEMYGDKRYPFEAPEWKELNIWTIELQENFRQEDIGFDTALDYLRVGDQVGLDLLRTREVMPWQANQNAINICPTRNQVAEINSKKLEELGNPIEEFEAVTSGKVKEIDKIAEDILYLSVGARIMMLNNDGRWYNGSLGTVVNFSLGCIQVRIDGSSQDSYVEPYTWNVVEYQLDKNKKIKQKIIGKHTQYPCKLAYAMTIHKSQGQTFDEVNVHTGFFDYGMMYVALSRCRSLGGLNIVGQLRPWELKCSPKVKSFMNITNILDEKARPELVKKDKVESMMRYVIAKSEEVVITVRRELIPEAMETFKDYPNVAIAVKNDDGNLEIIKNWSR